MGCSVSIADLSSTVPRYHHLHRGGHGAKADPPKKEELDPVRQAFLNNELLVDARCPLRSRQLYSLSKSWKTINRNMAVTAINMFVRLFEASGGIREMFASFKHVTNLAELRASAIFESHALKVISTIDDVIINFDDVDYVLKRLHDVAQFHCLELRLFQPHFFMLLEEPFIMAVREELGELFTASMEDTYRATIEFILETLVREFHGHLANQTEDGSKLVTQQSLRGATEASNDKRPITAITQEN